MQEATPYKRELNLTYDFTYNALLILIGSTTAKLSPKRNLAPDVRQRESFNALIGTMTIQKSLKYETENAGHGFPHRTHRSKGGKRVKGKKHKLHLEYKRKLEQLKISELDT